MNDADKNKEDKDMFCRAETGKLPEEHHDHAWADKAARTVIIIFCSIAILVILVSLILKLSVLKQLLRFL